MSHFDPVNCQSQLKGEKIQTINKERVTGKQDSLGFGEYQNKLVDKSVHSVSLNLVTAN